MAEDDVPKTAARNLEKKLSMEGGTGDGSYYRNSSTQASVIGEATPTLEKALRILEFGDDAGGVIRIVDLGCSTGPNTISVVNTVVNCLLPKHPLDRTEYQVFFCDLPSNDFNTLFSLIPSQFSLSTDGQDVSAKASSQHYYAAGVPGSFYERLFPKATLHVATSFSSLHWLSKIPEAVLDPSSAAWSKGKISINRADLPVVEAFSEQAKEDLRAFLKSRAEEMISGGLLFLLFAGRADHEHPEIPWPSLPFDPAADLSDPKYLSGSELQKTWDDLVSELD